jgi:uncharacterized protein YutD
MGANDRQEFIIMLLIENRSYTSNDGDSFYNFIKEHYNLEKFNERYMELLDKFMKPYALNKTEKSEEHD